MNCAVSTMLKYPACPSPVPACLPLQARPGGATPAATSLCPCPACATSRTRPLLAASRMSSGGAPLLGWGRGLPLHLGTCGYSALRLLQPLCLYCVVFPAASTFAAIRAHHTPALSANPPPHSCSRIIVDCEVNTGAWTLMHRFNKATDLLEDVMNVGGWAVPHCTAPAPVLLCSLAPSFSVSHPALHCNGLLVHSPACLAIDVLVPRACLPACRAGSRTRPAHWPASTSGCATAPSASSPGSATTTPRWVGGRAGGWLAGWLAGWLGGGWNAELLIGGMHWRQDRRVLKLIHCH
jgi:hypothetical protein